MDIVQALKDLAMDDAPLFKPPSEFREQEKGIANLFLIDVEPGRKAYRYDVDIALLTTTSDGSPYEKNLAKGSDEGLRARNRNLCYEILAAAYGKTAGFGIEGKGDLIYDCKSTLYTSVPIDMPDKNILLSNNDVNEFIQIYTSKEASFRVTISANSSGHCLELSDLEQYTTKRSLQHEDRSVRTFLEMALAQTPLNEDEYTRIGAGKLFEVPKQEMRSVGNGMVLRSGAAQGVRIVQNYGKPCPAVIIDAKISPFFVAQDLYKTIFDMCNRREPQGDRDWSNIGHLLMGVRVELINRRHRTFGIQNISKTSATETFFSYNNQQISVADYCSQVLGVTLRYPHWRVVVADSKAGEFYPAELCYVMPDQRVPLEKMGNKLSNDLLKVNSILPQQRMDRIMEHANRMRIFDPENSVLRAFGIRVISGSNEVQIGVRHNPRITFAGEQTVNVNPREVEWKRASAGMRFYKTYDVSNWIVLCHDCHKAEVREFVGVFKMGARRRGLIFTQDPILPPFDGGNWDAIFEKCSEKQVEYVMLIDPVVEDTHGMLKYYEAKYKVLTQHVTYEKAFDIIRDRRKMQTLENILNKTNCKFFGINYVPVFEPSASKFALETDKVLVLGYDIAHPPPMTMHERRMAQSVNIDLQSFDPSVVGITANMAAHPHNFVGDYFYQEARKDYLDTDQLAERVKWVLEMLEKNRPQAAAPPFIFVLRNGLSEGQFAASVEKEMRALRKGCALYREGYEPKFVYVIGTKRHFKKFFAQRERVENLTPGSVIASKFVREDCPEFFMMSHFPLKGVGKAVEYNVLVDDIKVSQDEVQGLLNSLCYSHQIVNSAASLPEPIYQADELAKRGRNNYITMKRLEEQFIPRKGECRLVDAGELTAMIGYKDSYLTSTRFTA